MSNENETPHVKVLWSDALLDTIVLRDGDCNRIIVDIGEPGKDGFYAPILTTDYDDNPLTQARRRIAELEESAQIQ